MEKFCLSATNITHFIHFNETDFGNVTKQAFIFEHDHPFSILTVCNFLEIGLLDSFDILYEVEGR